LSAAALIILAQATLQCVRDVMGAEIPHRRWIAFLVLNGDGTPSTSRRTTGRAPAFLLTANRRTASRSRF